MAYSVTNQDLRHQIVPAPWKLTAFAQENISKMSIYYLAENPSPAAFHYIQQHHSDSPHIGLLYIKLCQNPEMIAYIENSTNTDYLCHAILMNPNLSTKVLEMILALKTISENHLYQVMSANPSNVAVDYMIERHPDKIWWDEWSKNANPRAVAFLKKNPTRINYSYLSGNTSNEAMRLLAAHPERIDFDELSMNSNPLAFKLLMKYESEINYNNLAANSNPEAMAYSFKNSQWSQNLRLLSRNPSAITYLETNPEKVDWSVFWKNPAIFEKDYHAVVKERMPQLKEQLMQVALDPDRIDRLVEKGIPFKEIIDNL